MLYNTVKRTAYQYTIEYNTPIWLHYNQLKYLLQNWYPINSIIAVPCSKTNIFVNFIEDSFTGILFATIILLVLLAETRHFTCCVGDHLFVTIFVSYK